MHILIFEASPNTDGLTAACAAAAAEGVSAAGGCFERIPLAERYLTRCNQCDDGWGGCRSIHHCDGSDDDFEELHGALMGTDGLVLVTPVYWGDMSESMKAFTDRLRRCEATLGEQSRLFGKPVLLVAAAGGGGGGMISCLANMERWVQHVRALPWDMIGIKRITREVKLATIRASAEAMVRAHQG
ncbi:MAG: flavodoxin family protein [Anaerolineae bacterium]|jgi:multimeric flavodoxin WrbA|nr:NAD(P)H-dependent oxidoreductase [Chloroflexota bacterium]